MITKTINMLDKASKVYDAVKEVLLWAIIAVLIFTNNVLSKFSVSKYTLSFFIASIFFGSVINLVYVMFKEGLIN